jgi:hypothetical protein
MSMLQVMQQFESAIPRQANGVRLLKPLQFNDRTPHQEINPSPDQPTEWIVVRSGRETIVVNLKKALNGEYVEECAA